MVKDWRSIFPTCRKIPDTSGSSTMATPRGEDLDKLSMANALAEWLYFSKLTGSIEKEEYEKWKLCVELIPGAGEYLQLLSAPEYNNLQGKVLRDFASKVKERRWP
jgi:hypothetical protein